MKYSGIGGQAVIEGVMMKGRSQYAVSVRKPDGQIEVKVENYKSLKEKYCRRPSPYPGYEEYTCGEAVKSIKDRFEKRRRTEYERLRLKAAEYGTLSPHCGNFNSFCAKCDYYKNQLKKGASVELLQEYGKYLFDNPILRTKYERIKKW